MSSVRMCDDCGFVFSENNEGWSNGTVNQMVRDDKTGQIKPKTVSVDYCPECTEAKTTSAVRPQSPAVARKEIHGTITGTVVE